MLLHILIAMTGFNQMLCMIKQSVSMQKWHAMKFYRHHALCKEHIDEILFNDLYSLWLTTLMK